MSDERRARTGGTKPETPRRLHAWVVTNAFQNFVRKCPQEVLLARMRGGVTSLGRLSTGLTRMALSASISAAIHNYEHIARIPGRTPQPERFGAFDRTDNPREPRA